MTIRFDGDIAWLEGACDVADAEPLFASLVAGRTKKVDVSGCTVMHGAVAETLLRFSVAAAGQALDPFLRDFVIPALERRRGRGPR